MTDQATVTISEYADGSSAGRSIVIGFKCWHGSPNSTKFMIATSEKYDAAATYNRLVLASVRIDKREPWSIWLIPTNVRGFLVFTTQQSEMPSVLDVIREVKDAKMRISATVMSSVVTFPATKSSKAVAEMEKTCALQLPPPQPD